jgi:hypothetical protein
LGEGCWLGLLGGGLEGWGRRRGRFGVGARGGGGGRGGIVSLLGGREEALLNVVGESEVRLKLMTLILMVVASYIRGSLVLVLGRADPRHL